MWERNSLTSVAGVFVGHADDHVVASGVTAIVFANPATVGVAVQGGAPGGREQELLAPEMTMERVDAVVLSGGSALGLDAAGGVQAALREDGRGWQHSSGQRVPLTPQAILFDLANGGAKDWGRFSPYRDLGYAAARAATDAAVPMGSVGAGLGATTATLKGGLGCAGTVTPQGFAVAALAVVNALGSAVIGDSRHFWAAPFEVADEFGGHGWPGRFTPEDVAMRIKRPVQPGTTIGIVATDAVLSKAQAKRMAIMAHDGLARAVLPAHAPLDGDTIFAAATGARPLGEDPVGTLTALGHAAAACFARAVARGVYEATALPFPGAQPAWRDRFGAIPAM